MAGAAPAHVEFHRALSARSISAGKLSSAAVFAGNYERNDGVPVSGVHLQLDGVPIGGTDSIFSTLDFRGNSVSGVGNNGEADSTIINYAAAASQTLATTLTAGASAGALPIDMNGNDVTGIGARLNVGNFIAIGNGATTGSAVEAIALGNGAAATGDNAIAVGSASTASFASAIAVGGHATSTADNSIALGPYATASNTRAVAIGHLAQASGHSSVATGHNALASGTGSVAVGANADATGEYAIAIGSGAIAGAQATGDYAIAIGVGTASTHTESICLGKGATSTADHELTIQTDQANGRFIKTTCDLSENTAGPVALYLEIIINGTAYKIALHDLA